MKKKRKYYPKPKDARGKIKYYAEKIQKINLDDLSDDELIEYGVIMNNCYHELRYKVITNNKKVLK